jgi:hypothetical protein
MAGCREKKRTRPVGARAICGREEVRERKDKSTRTHLANGQNIVNIHALKQRPHGKVDIDQPPSKVEAAWKAGDDLEIPVLAAALRAGVEFDKIAGARGGVGKDF